MPTLRNPLNPFTMGELPKSHRLDALGVAKLPEVPFRWREDRWDLGSPTQSFQALLRRAVTCEIGGDSAIDVVYVTPANGPTFRVAVGARMPDGDWEGPFEILPGRRKTVRFLDPSVIDTWRTAGGAVPGIENQIEVVFYPSRELAAAHPVQVKRAPLVITHINCTKATDPNTAGILALLPFQGRKRATFTIKSTNQQFEGSIFGANVMADDGTGAMKRLWPAAGNFLVAASISVGETIVVENEQFEYLILNGHHTAGANGLASIHLEARDD